MVNAITENLLNPKQTLNDVQTSITHKFEDLKNGVTSRALSTRDAGYDAAWGFAESSLTITRRWANAGNDKTVDRIQRALVDVQAKRREIAQPKIARYDEMNVKQILEALDSLGHFDLTKALEYEKTNKSRKTVIEAVEKRLAL